MTIPEYDKECDCDFCKGERKRKNTSEQPVKDCCPLCGKHMLWDQWNENWSCRTHGRWDEGVAAQPERIPMTSHELAPTGIPRYIITEPQLAAIEAVLKTAGVNIRRNVLLSEIRACPYPPKEPPEKTEKEVINNEEKQR